MTLSNIPVSIRIFWQPNQRKKHMTEYDLADLICPLSKLNATEIIVNLTEGVTAKIILGSTDFLKSVAK